KDRLEVNGLFRMVVKLHAQNIRSNDLESLNAVNGMNHIHLLQRIDRHRRLTSLQTLPVRQQFRLMKLRPGLYKAPLSPGQGSSDQLDRIQTINGDVIL